MKSWKLISSKNVLSSKWMSVEKRTYELPGGKVVDDFYHLKRSDYVLIIAQNNQNEIAVIKQYRRGVDDEVYELPAGWIEKGESPKEAALRELEEETGLSGEVKFVQTLYAQPEFTDMKAFVVGVAVNSKSKNFLTLNDIDNRIKSGEIKDMGLISAISVLRARAF